MINIQISCAKFYLIRLARKRRNVLVFVSMSGFYSVESSIERRGTGTREKKKETAFTSARPRGYRANRKRYTMRYIEWRQAV